MGRSRDLGRGLRQMLGDARLHPRALPRVLLTGETAQGAARDGGFGDDVGLAGRGDAEALLINRGGGAAGHAADLVGVVGIGPLAAEGVVASHPLVDRAIADALSAATDPIAGANARCQLPTGRTAAGDRAVFGIGRGSRRETEG